MAEGAGGFVDLTDLDPSAAVAGIAAVSQGVEPLAIAVRTKMRVVRRGAADIEPSAPLTFRAAFWRAFRRRRRPVFCGGHG